jgi:hypothetical protein
MIKVVVRVVQVVRWAKVQHQLVQPRVTLCVNLAMRATRIATVMIRGVAKLVQHVLLGLDLRPCVLQTQTLFVHRA